MKKTITKVAVSTLIVAAAAGAVITVVVDKDKWLKIMKSLNS